MKTKHFFFGLCTILLVLSACREITVRTEVHGDGSFTRSVVIKGDSSEVYRMDLPYPVDSSWTKVVANDTADSTKLVLTYTKHFSTDADLENEIKADTGWTKDLPRSITIRRHFGFFYTRFTYTEVYRAANPFRLLPWKKYVSSEDYLWITRQKPIQTASDSTREKRAEDSVIQFLIASASAELEKTLSEGISKLHNPGLDSIRVSRYNDSIQDFLGRWDVKDPLEIIDHFARWTGNPAVLSLKALQPALFTEFGKKARFVDNLLGLQDFRIEATMPGMITATTSTTLKGNTVQWTVFPMSFLLEDQVMTVESKVMNTWAFLVAGIVLFSLVVLVLVRIFRK